ncbi:FAD:protein FMN transferase [Pseudooceanicola nanhaiensis]|uniref:FAD:protein FMN transferase n=1 Tax=Pseudooceanicola nanhaiensis TaxID=375761 RepID=UPI001CD5BD9B|nr:FAD:protein FMN transferase [Pseudooceanicola nanhaiensis]MCA0920191.1 FAD:protein FMN transferase [Pseudooceanicola nanhaiensis]
MTRAPRLLMAGIAVLALALPAGLLRARPEAELHQTAYVFGTLVEIVIRDTDPAEARAAAADLGALFQELHNEWHAWRPGAVTTLNEAIARGEAADVLPRVADLVTRAQALSAASGGRFEPGIGRLIGLWGFHQDTPPEGAPPAPAEVARLRDAHPSIADLRVEGTRITSTNAMVSLDFGGFAKGAALALARDHLAARGIRDAVLNAGGDVTVMGRHGARPWRVAIRDPFVWGAIASVELAPGESLYTSGNYERFFESGGIRFAHILDPATGAPVQEIVSVSVLDSDPARADAAATALAVAGRADWPAVASAMGVSAVLMIAQDGAMMASPAMAARLAPVGAAFPTPLRVVALPGLG